MNLPRPGAYRPFVVARAPRGRPVSRPRRRLLVHRQYADTWAGIADRVGLENVQQFYDHVTSAPDRHPDVGTSGMLRGKHNRGKDGWSNRIHYEITGAGRINYEYHPAYRVGADEDEHPVVRILSIDLGSH